MMSILENVEVRVCEIWFEHILSVHFRMAHAAPCISLIHGFTDLHISTYERFHHVLVMRPWRASPSRPTGPSLPASLSLSPSRYLSLSPARASTHASPPPPVAARPSVSHLLTFLRSFALFLLLPPSLPLPDISVQLATPNRSGIGNHTGAGVGGIGNGAPAAMDIGGRLDQGCQIVHFWRMHFFHKLQPELQWTRRSGFVGNCCSAAEEGEDYLRTS